MVEEVTQVEEKPRMHGCLKGCLVFLGICVLVFIIAVGIIYYKKDYFVNWAFNTMEAKFIEILPEDIDREKFSKTLTRLKTAVANEEISSEELKEILPEFQSVMEDGKLDADEVNHLLEIINNALEEEIPAETVSPSSDS